jgi:hypothetical protein
VNELRSATRALFELLQHPNPYSPVWEEKVRDAVFVLKLVLPQT